MSHKKNYPALGGQLEVEFHKRLAKILSKRDQGYAMGAFREAFVASGCTAATAPVDWVMCERISDVDQVDEALRTFSEDATQDNATGAIQAALTAYLADTRVLTDANAQRYLKLRKDDPRWYVAVTVGDVVDSLTGDALDAALDASP